MQFGWTRSPLKSTSSELRRSSGRTWGFEGPLARVYEGGSSEMKLGAEGPKAG